MGLFDAFAGIMNSIISNATNTKLARETNNLNERLTDKANALQVAESEKAYQRSKASNQVGLLEQAGMSRAGAIQSLNGGGSYTPASINAAQAEAPQIDGSLMQSALSNLGQTLNLKEQIKAAKEQQEASIEAEERKQDKQIAWEREQWNKEEARKEYQESLTKLSVDARNVASEVESLANPADYDTPAAYRNAIYEKASEKQRAYFKNADFTTALDAYHSVNLVSKSTVSSTKKTDAEALYTEEQKNMLTKQLEEFNNSKSLRDKQRHAQELVEDLKAKAAEMDISEQELEDSLYWEVGEDGKRKPKGWKKVDEKMSRFWNTVCEIIPVNTVLEALGLVLKAL